jgi:hypothetical protein
VLLLPTLAAFHAIYPSNIPKNKNKNKNIATEVIVVSSASCSGIVKSTQRSTTKL